MVLNIKSFKCNLGTLHMLLFQNGGRELEDCSNLWNTLLPLCSCIEVVSRLVLVNDGIRFPMSHDQIFHHFQINFLNTQLTIMLHNISMGIIF